MNHGIINIGNCFPPIRPWRGMIIASEPPDLSFGLVVRQSLRVLEDCLAAKSSGYL
jgi:hypothetical protein